MYSSRPFWHVILALLFSAAVFAAPQSPATCTDGGTLQCCEASFTGSALPVELAADFLCYDLTPAVDNCIITSAPSDPDTGCVGQPMCCQVNDFAPVIGLFCSKPPGDCRGKEGGKPPYCLEVINGRFGNCTEADINRGRGDLGLGPIGDVLEGVAGTVNPVTDPIVGPVGGTVGGVLGGVTGSLGLKERDDEV